MAKFNDNAYYRNLSRIFRNGPSVPHQIANKTAGPGEFVGVPIGTAAAYFKSSTNSFSNYVSHYGNYSRLARYADYQNMEQMAEIASALDIYAHECCAKGEYGEILKVESDNPQIKEALTKLFYDTLNIEFNAASWIRSMCKYGDYFLLLDHHPDFGILNVFPMPVNEVEREEGYDPKNPTAFRYRWSSNQNRVIEPWQVIHFRMTGNDNFLPYGMSLLEPARRAWRQLVLMEDAVMVYRIVRSPERRVFYIDIGNIAPSDVPAVVERMKTATKGTQVVDANSGQVDLRFNALSVSDDFYIPVRGQDTGTRIETLPGGAFVGDIDDLQYIQNKLFAALKVPKSYLGYEGDLGAKSSLSQQDVRFARTIQHIQRIFLAELEKMAMIQLYSMGLRDEDILDFELTMANPSAINEIQRLELWRTRFEVASVATGQDGVLDKTFIYRHIFKLNNADIESIEEGRRKDKLFQLEIDGMQLPVDESAAMAPPEGDAGAAEAPGGAGMPPAAPDDGSVANNVNAPLDNNAPATEAPPPPPTEGRDPHVQRAMPNDMKVMKDKPRKRDSEKALVYRTKKNGLDPRHELGQLRRVATSPFGEADENGLFQKQVKLLNKHTEVLNAAEQLSAKAKKVL